MKTASQLSSWQPVRLPSAFNQAQESKQKRRAAATAHQQRSMAGAHTVLAVTSGMALLEINTPIVLSRGDGKS